jgi:hypothetical protein
MDLKMWLFFKLPLVIVRLKQREKALSNIEVMHVFRAAIFAREEKEPWKFGPSTKTR